MDGGRRQGKPEDELFLRPSDSDPSTIAPLRINKPTSPPPRTGSGQSADGAYRPPAVNPPYPVSSPPPTGPLPYPTQQQQANAGRYTPLSDRERNGKNSTPEEGRRRRSSTTQPSGSPRTKFSANDPNRPTVAGYSHPPAQGLGLSERRGNTPKPLPDSPGPDTPDKEGLFAKPVRAGTAPVGGPIQPQGLSEDPLNPYPQYHQQYWPPSGGAAGSSKGPGLNIPNPGGINRLSSTASTSTTKAQRGSPPPPETPIVGPPAGGIEARYAAAGIAGTSTLSSIQAQNAAAAQRANPYAGAPRPPLSTSPPEQQQPPRRPWTPTEPPGSQPHVVYQGASEVMPQSAPNGPSPQPSQPLQPSQPFQPAQPAQPAQAAQAAQAAGLNHEQALEHDLARMNVHDEPPPAYSTVHPGGPPGATTAQGYPNDKRQTVVQPTPGVAGVMADSNISSHPAFANDPQRQGASSVDSLSQAGPSNIAAPAPVSTTPGPSNGPGPSPASPPPLPEGWIAHLDQNSGQYYYIHLLTQSTQWEFPKGPTPLNLNEPMSPTTGTFVNPLTSPGLSAAFTKPLASPGIAPQQAYQDNSLSLAGLSSPTAAGFTGPPPQAGVDMYKVAPTNGVYFGPYLRYTNMDLERGLWLGSILLVTDAPHPPTIHIHQSTDLSPNRKLHQRDFFNV
jgi:hypothetical protein